MKPSKQEHKLFVVVQVVAKRETERAPVANAAEHDREGTRFKLGLTEGKNKVSGKT